MLIDTIIASEGKFVALDTTGSAYFLDERYVTKEKGTKFEEPLMERVLYWRKIGEDEKEK